MKKIDRKPPSKRKSSTYTKSNKGISGKVIPRGRIFRISNKGFTYLIIPDAFIHVHDTDLNKPDGTVIDYVIGNDLEIKII